MYSAGATSTSRSRETSQVSKNQDGTLQPGGKKYVVSSSVSNNLYIATCFILPVHVCHSPNTNHSVNI